MSEQAKRQVDVEECFPEWLIVLSGRIVAAVKAGEFGRQEVAQLIAQSILTEDADRLVQTIAGEWVKCRCK